MATATTTRTVPPSALSESSRTPTPTPGQSQSQSQSQSSQGQQKKQQLPRMASWSAIAAIGTSSEGKITMPVDIATTANTNAATVSEDNRSSIENTNVKATSITKSNAKTSSKETKNTTKLEVSVSQSSSSAVANVNTTASATATSATSMKKPIVKSNPWNMNIGVSASTSVGKAALVDNNATSVVGEDSNAPTPAESKGMKVVVKQINSSDDGSELKKKNGSDNDNVSRDDSDNKENNTSGDLSKQSSPKSNVKNGTPNKANKQNQQHQSKNQYNNNSNKNGSIVKRNKQSDSSPNARKTQSISKQQQQRAKKGTSPTNKSQSSPSSSSNNKNKDRPNYTNKSSNNKTNKKYDKRNKNNHNNKHNKKKNKDSNNKNKNNNNNDTAPRFYTGKIPLTQQQKNKIKPKAVTQVEYFFSTTELAKNVFLRRYMDCCGYVPFAIVHNFPSILSFHLPYMELLTAIHDLSKKIEVDFENECVRIKCKSSTSCDDGEVDDEMAWKKWLFPNPDGTLGCPRWIKEASVPSQDTTEGVVDTTGDDSDNGLKKGDSKSVDTVASSSTEGGTVDKEDASSDTSCSTEANSEESSSVTEKQELMTKHQNSGSSNRMPDLAMTDSDTENTDGDDSQ